MISRRTVIRLIAVERGLSAVALMAWPEPIARTLNADNRLNAGATVSTTPAWVVRLLGARLLGQGIVEFVRPDHRIVRAAAVVDAAHALSMIAAAAALPSHRRVAAISAGEAGLSAAAGVILLRKPRRAR